MYIDTHAHLYIDRFDEDIDEVISRCHQEEVNKIILPNIDLNTIDRVFDLSEKYPDMCYPAVGLHPCSVGANWEEDLRILDQYLDKDGVIAVGEIGVDLYWDKTFAKAQEQAFRHQIAWAKERSLPIIIHSRSAIDITIRIVREMQDGYLKGVFHCFDQSDEEAQQILDTGFYIGIGGIITYKRNEQLRATVSHIPLDHIILETDAPYLPPVPYRGKRNESSYLTLVASKLAEVYQLSIQEIKDRTTQNAQSLFGIQ